MFFSACSLHVFCNTTVDEFRRSIRTAPDTARAAILVTIAQMFYSENMDSSLYYAQSATEMAFRTRQYRALIDSETLQSQIMLERRDYVAATRHQRTVLDMATRLRNWDLAMESNHAIARTWLLRNNFAEAVEFLKRGLDIAKDRNNLEFQRHFCQALIDAYRNLHRIDDVIEYYAMLVEVNRAIDAETFNNQIAAMQNEDENMVAEGVNVVKLEQQYFYVSKIFTVWAILVTLALLTSCLWFQYRFKPGIVKKQKSLSDAVKEYGVVKENQERIFQFLTNHTNKNVNSLAERISFFIAEQNNLPSAVANGLNRINSEIFAIYGYFKDFMFLLQIRSKQYKLELATVNIPQLANNLLIDYEDFAAEKNIQLINEVQNNTLAIADKKLINIVIRNLMVIAFNYSTEGKGKITVGTKIGSKRMIENDFFDDAEFIELWVICDGFGLTSEQKIKMFELINDFSLPEDSETKSYELGLAVCKAVVESLNGNIWAETLHGEDLCIRFNLPKSKDAEVITKSLNLTENTQETISTENLPGRQLLLE